jgi:hypothetical protein
MRTKLLNRDALAQRLEISPARVQQLTGIGVLERKAGGYDLTDCALALLQYIRRDEAAQVARTRRITAAAAISERRQRIALRQLVTLEEVRVTLLDLWGLLHGALRAGSQEAFASLSAELGDARARVLTGKVYDSVLGALHLYRDAALRAIEELRQGLHAERRLDQVVDQLRRAVTGDEDAEDDD